MHEFSFDWLDLDTDEYFEVFAIYWPPVKAAGEFWGAEYDDSDPAEITITKVLDSAQRTVFNYNENECKAAAFEAYEKQLQEM